MTNRAVVVVDLGFGDAGKGLLTDHLVRTTGATLVVRYNGGAQAGHNVVTPDGRHHTFAQLGSGSFVPGVRTFLSRHMVVHPTALVIEAVTLETKDVPEPLSRVHISERARIITPFHQSLNRLRELARGDGRHGSCGVGVGETVADALAHPDDAIIAGDLRRPAVLRQKLGRIQERLRAEALRLLPELTKAANPELLVFKRREVLEAWALEVTRLARLVVDDSLLTEWQGNVVFEGAQGVLLDESRGFHPHTTWSRCTADNAIALAREMRAEPTVETIGVLRAHAIRHGAGPFPTETPALAGTVPDHNEQNAWQGAVRYGHFDAVLARYALAVAGRIDALAITHLDTALKHDCWRFATAYETPSLRDLPVSPEPSMEEQERLTTVLRDAVPRFEETSADGPAIIGTIEAVTGRRVRITSQGPSSRDVVAR